MANNINLSDFIVVTGGAGFIGSHFVKTWIEEIKTPIINIDKLTYASNQSNLADLNKRKDHIFLKTDISDRMLVRSILLEYKPRAVINFAAETHVDRSIQYPENFVSTNINGTFCLLQEVTEYWKQVSMEYKNKFRFIQISTDEVYGCLSKEAAPFDENSSYAPNSPYSASKASADHLVRAFNKTYSLPTITTNCSNNYGPQQALEKLIPLTILNALEGKSIPIYGDGSNVRDWIYVNDHCKAIIKLITHGKIGESYCIGGGNEHTNFNLVKTICEFLDEYIPLERGKTYKSLIKFVPDRLGHDFRYAISNNKITRETGWVPEKNFESGIGETVEWYVKNPEWVENAKNVDFQEWVAKQYNSTITN